MNHFAAPSRPFRWFRALFCPVLFCPVLGHRWLVSSDNKWRCCSHCHKEETRGEQKLWD